MWLKSQPHPSCVSFLLSNNLRTFFDAPKSLSFLISLTNFPPKPPLLWGTYSSPSRPSPAALFDNRIHLRLGKHVTTVIRATHLGQLRTQLAHLDVVIGVWVLVIRAQRATYPTIASNLRTSSPNHDVNRCLTATCATWGYPRRQLAHLLLIHTRPLFSSFILVPMTLSTHSALPRFARPED